MAYTTDALGAWMRFEELAGQIGLTVNRSKTELLCSGGVSGSFDIDKILIPVYHYQF